MDHQHLDTCNYWANLPSDIQQEILLHLSVQNLLRFASTNKIIMEYINDNHILWRELYNRRAADSTELDVTKRFANSDIKNEYRIMFQRALPWTCTLCTGCPIDHFAYKCLHCEDFTCCQPCYEKHSHFKNHVLLKYYRRVDPASKINYKLDDRLTTEFERPSCSKCHIALQYPTNRSATDEQIYLCDTCVTSEEFAQHRVLRVKMNEVRMTTPHTWYVNNVVCTCAGCRTMFVVPSTTQGWPYQCVTCRTTLTLEGVICDRCHSNSEVMAKHDGHTIIPLPPVHDHKGSCECCKRNPRSIRYKCAVCTHFDYCEYCEVFAPYHYDGQHPMMVLHHLCVFKQIMHTGERVNRREIKFN